MTSIILPACVRQASNPYVIKVAGGGFDDLPDGLYAIGTSYQPLTLIINKVAGGGFEPPTFGL